MRFTKMHGLGNDFVIIVGEQVPENVSQLAEEICHRRTGVGADGLVFLLPSKHGDCRMRIFNSDGSEARQCGNALRCIAKYYYERLDSSKKEISVETTRGLQSVWLQATGGMVEQVRVDMGEPIFSAREIPMMTEQDQVTLESLQVEDRTFSVTALSMGNPHAVIEVADAANYPVKLWGPKIEMHEVFPDRINVEFVTFHSPEEITMRVWERGAGETMACGSGACAVLVAGVRTEKVGRKATVHLLGGDLEIEWSSEDNHVYMMGPAAYVFEGEY